MGGILKEEPATSVQDAKPTGTEEVAPKKRSFIQSIKDDYHYRRTAISGIDNMLLLLAGTSGYNPVCISVCTYKGELSFDGLLAAWENMISRYPRYRQKLTGRNRRFHTARLVDDPTFNIRDYFTSIRLPDGANGKRELEQVVSEMAARPWDLDKPLWEATVLYNYSDAEGAGSAVIVRAHHSLADGQGYVVSQLTTCTSSPDEPLEKSIKSEAELKEEILKRAGLWKEKSNKPVSPVIKYGRKAQKLVSQTLFMIVAVIYGLWLTLVNMYWMATFKPRALVHDGLRPTEREYAFSEKISIADIKLCQKAFKSKGRKITLNDVMCAVVARAMYDYFKEVGEYPDRRVAFYVPLSIRMPWETSMGNFSTGQVMYFKAEDTLTRQQLIDAAHDEMNTLKKNVFARILYNLVRWGNNIPALTPPKSFMKNALTNSHGVFTNVPGPSAPIYQHGTEVLRWMACPPQLGAGTLGVGMISYNGYLSWTVLADKMDGRKADVAHKLAEAFVHSFKGFLEEAQALTKGE